MGTSQSSRGPGGGVPMVPPWVPELPPDVSGDDEPGGDGPAQQLPNVDGPRLTVPIAPAARFSATRRNLGDYAKSGGGGSLRRSLGHYTRSGYGGARTATRRFGGTVATADALGRALANVASGRPAEAGSRLDPALLAGRSAREITDAVVEAIRPVDGTQDTEAARVAIRDALADLLTRFPEADLLTLDANQRDFVIERYVAMDVFRRFDLDVGKTVLEKAPTASAALGRLKEIRDFVKEVVAASFRRLRERGQLLTSGRIAHVVRDALADAFAVFEEYAE